VSVSYVSPGQRSSPSTKDVGVDENNAMELKPIVFVPHQGRKKEVELRG
jgi:hypothetical protein